MAEREQGVFQAALSAGVSTGAVGAGRFELHAAAAACNFGRIADLLAQGADINEYNGQGETPLICAVQRGGRRCHEVVRYLIRHRADENLPLLQQGAGAPSRDRGARASPGRRALDRGVAEGPTPLHLAAARGHTSCARDLLSATSHKGVLAPWPRAELGQAAMSPGDCVTCLHVAAAAGHTELARWLCTAHAGLARQPSLGGWFPLHMVRPADTR